MSTADDSTFPEVSTGTGKIIVSGVGRATRSVDVVYVSAAYVTQTRQVSKVAWG